MDAIQSFEWAAAYPAWSSASSRHRRDWMGAYGVGQHLNYYFGVSSRAATILDAARHGLGLRAKPALGGCENISGTAEAHPKSPAKAGARNVNSRLIHKL